MRRPILHRAPPPAQPWPALPARARRAIALTRAALWWEAIARAFWPAASLAAAGLAALALGAGQLPVVGDWLGPALLLLFTVLLVIGWRKLRRPASGAALARVDALLPGRPLSTLTDRLALGQDDPETAALWQAHQARAKQNASRARPAAPHTGLARHDPFALRLVALTGLAMAVIFGNAAGLGHGWGALASGLGSQRPPIPGKTDTSNWEGWAEPPAHTRKPTIYLNILPEGEVLKLPQGSRVSLRLYDSGRFTQDIGPNDSDSTADAPVFHARQNGVITLPGGRQITISIIPDTAPVVQAGKAAERRADGRLIQGFTASDDYGIATGHAEIALDLDAVSRRYGLTRAPEPREALQLDLPLPARGRDKVQGRLTADLSRHPYANLPVTLTLQVEDGLGQTGQAQPLRMTLPGRRFFDPAAAALIEMRQALLWNRKNQADAARILRAITWQPDDLLDTGTTDIVHTIIARLEDSPLSARDRDDLAEILWQTAVTLEDGGLSDALERMKRAQKRLSEAMRQGASPDEIARLMRELREATDAYTRMLAEQGDDPADRFTKREPGQNISANQLQDMMDEIERLMREGRTAEAQELLQQFNRLMKNLSVRQGGDGEDGMGGGSRDQAMDGLTDTLRQQQGLADDAMRRQRDEDGMWQPRAPGDADDLAEEQRDLREQLGRQRGLMPGQGSAQGDAAAEDLDRAGRAMEEAEDALRDGDIGTAMDRQAEAISRMREGMRQLGRMDHADQDGQHGDEGGESADGETGAKSDGSPSDGQRGNWQNTRRDPLGRNYSGSGGGTIITDGPLAEGETADPARRARELQDEIRRRLGDSNRPKDERDYLDRLLDRF